MDAPQSRRSARSDSNRKGPPRPWHQAPLGLPPNAAERSGARDRKSIADKRGDLGNGRHLGPPPPADGPKAPTGSGFTIRPGVPSGNPVETRHAMRRLRESSN